MEIWGSFYCWSQGPRFKINIFIYRENSKHFAVNLTGTHMGRIHVYTVHTYILYEYNIKRIVNNKNVKGRKNGLS